MTSAAPDYFNKQAAQHYDERNGRLAAIGDCMHFLIRLVLRELPREAHVLCVGVGTGAEILSLAAIYPSWTFVGVDPSGSMLAICQNRLEAAGFADRCHLVHGFSHELPEGENFDAALSVLVAHFVPRGERLAFLRSMTNRLKTGGRLVTVEIAGDLDAAEFPEMMRDWEKVQEMLGATAESLANLPKLLREMLTVLPVAESEDLLRQSGIATPLHFFKALMMNGWHGQKL